jgi:hypothetical protein
MFLVNNSWSGNSAHQGFSTPTQFEYQRRPHIATTDGRSFAGSECVSFASAECIALTGSQRGSVCGTECIALTGSFAGTALC